MRIPGLFLCVYGVFLQNTQVLELLWCYLDCTNNEFTGKWVGVSFPLRTTSVMF